MTDPKPAIPYHPVEGLEVSDTYWTQWTAAGGPFPPDGFPLERAWAKTVKGELN